MEGVVKKFTDDGHFGAKYTYSINRYPTIISVEIKMRPFCCGVWELGGFVATRESTQEKVTEFLQHVMSCLKRSQRSAIHCNLAYYGQIDIVPLQNLLWVTALKACKFQAHPFRWKNKNTGNWIEEWSYFTSYAKAPKKYFPATQGE